MPRFMIGHLMEKTQLYDALLDALYQTFGVFPGFRVAHAKGILLRGSFIASEQASTISRARHFQGDKIPVLFRFSNFSGFPTTPDNDPQANPRGLSLRFILPQNGSTDIIFHSFNGFPVATPEEFLGFLQGIAASAQDPQPFQQFLSAHPRARHYIETEKPTPRSYLSEHYFGVNALQFENSKGIQITGRYRVDPLVPADYWDAETAAKQQPDYLQHELIKRLENQQPQLRLMLQIANAQDVTADGSQPWPYQGKEARREVELGVLTLESLHPDLFMQEKMQRELGFNPGALTDGIALSDDPMIAARQAIYDRAVKRRQQAADPL